MKRYEKLFIGLSLLIFISCDSSGGSTSSTSQSLVNQESETSTIDSIVVGDGEIQISNGIISINDANKTALSASNGGQVTNGTDGIVSGVFAVGMEASGTGSQVTNDGSIVGVSEVITKSVVSSYTEKIDRIGMKASDGAKAINNGEISGTISEGIVVDGTGSIAINNGKVSSTGVEYTYIETDEDGIECNETGVSAKGMKALNGANIINGENGIISGTIGEGMRADGSDSTAINNGSISSTGAKYDDIYTKDGIEYHETGISGIGMKATDGGSITNNGTISGTIGQGMRAQGTGSTAVNNGDISSTGSEWTETSIGEDGTKDVHLDDYAIGMYARDGGSVTNGEAGVISGTIGQGIYAIGDGSTAVNDGSISSTGYKYTDTETNEDGTEKTYSGTRGAIGMYARDGGSVTNGEAGVILGTIDTGMKATGENSIATNFGTININLENGIGMSAEDGATAINEETGIINLNGSNGIGMYATGEGSTIENRGEIYLSGTQANDGYLTAEEIATSGEMISNGMDDKGNIGMKIENGAKMINKGSIVFGE